MKGAIFFFVAILCVGLTALKGFYPSSQSGQYAQSFSDSLIAWGLLLTSLVAAVCIGKFVIKKNGASSALLGFFSLVLYAPALYAASTGWVRIFARAGKFSDYAVMESPEPYWMAFLIYLLAGSTLLACSIAGMQGGARKGGG
ncbi:MULTISPECIES: hypothetical protein [Xanthomonas]|uniref:Uncharacterized protein n=1 Tax=Xanthomonas dyei TaxID=743699 RepID=A0ABZ0D790_9XANT|nr:hypothetical protein [Xanthomonas dyei]WOB25662.1 hypothetical protein NYR99_18430 [Xanthomonas dyei]WOB53288.1 hypothetical protein NYR95_18435 [Xanthomonas dyei]